MATAQWFVSKASGSSAPNTLFCTLRDSHVGPSTTEAVVQTPSRSAGTFSKLYIRVTVNDRTATSTLTFRTGGADGNQSVSIGAGLTGDFMDSSSTDAVAGAGELLDAKLIVGTGGTVFTWALLGILFTPTTGTITRFQALGASTTVAPGSTQYQALAGLGSTQTTEASEQHKIRITGQLRFLYANIAVNSLSTASTTIRTRKGGANGAQSVVIGAGLTGVFEDTSNTDSVITGDLVNYQTVVAAPGTGTISYGNVGCELYASSGEQYQLINATNNGLLVTQNTTVYVSPSGALSSNATEDNVKGRVNANGLTASKLQCYVISNSIAATSTLRTRKNSGNGGQSISIGSTLTGFFEDGTNTDTYATNDYIDYQVVTGASGSNTIRINNIGLLVTPIGVLAPSGIASTFSLGSDKLNPKIFMTPVTSTLALGSDRLSSIVTANGIASTVALGTAKLNLRILASSRTSTLAFGTAAIFVQGVLGPTGIASTLAIGAAKLNPKIFMSGRASTIQIGSARLVPVSVLLPSGIASGLVVGTSNKLNLTIFPASKTSGITIGTAFLFVPGLSSVLVVPAIISTLQVGGPYLVGLMDCIEEWQELPTVGPSGFQAALGVKTPSSGVGGWD